MSSKSKNASKTSPKGKTQAPAKVAKKSKAASTEGKTTPKRTNNADLLPKATKRTFKSYITRVLKDSLGENRSISAYGSDVLDQLVFVWIAKIAKALNALILQSAKKTVKQEAVEAAVYITFPEALSKEIVAAAKRAVVKYDNAPEKAEGPKGKKRSAADKAGLIFPPKRVGGFLRRVLITGITKQNTTEGKVAKAKPVRLAADAAIFLAAALEAVMKYVLSKAVETDSYRNGGRQKIAPIDIGQAIDSDMALRKIHKRVIINVRYPDFSFEGQKQEKMPGKKL